MFNNSVYLSSLYLGIKKNDQRLWYKCKYSGKIAIKNVGKIKTTIGK